MAKSIAKGRAGRTLERRILLALREAAHLGAATGLSIVQDSIGVITDVLNGKRDLELEQLELEQPDAFQPVDAAGRAGGE